MKTKRNSWKRMVEFLLIIITILSVGQVPVYASVQRLTTVPSSWQRSYYKAVNKQDYVKLTINKNGFTAKLYRKGKKTQTIEKTYFVTSHSESLKPESNGRLAQAYSKSFILYSMRRKSEGKIVCIEEAKHIYRCTSLEYLPGNYYRTLKTAKKHVQPLRW